MAFSKGGQAFIVIKCKGCDPTYSQILYVSFILSIYATLMLKLSILEGDDVNGGFSHYHGRIFVRSRIAVKEASQKPFLKIVRGKE
ncbi:hypothetical protein J26TS2_23780 [Shouchella clausii]|nr:hypothetical protein J26TS2_23780 [Shouchella clausii]